MIEKKGFDPGQVEQKEVPRSRDMEILLVRHGKQKEYADPSSELSEEGERQAEEFAKELLDRIKGEDVAIKVMRSPSQRASRTAEIIQDTLQSSVSAEELENIQVMESHERVNLKQSGALGPLIEKGVPLEQLVDEWLENSEKHSVRSPEDVYKELKELIDISHRLAARISPVGPKIIYIWVSHETAHAAILNTVAGKKLNDVGGNVGHLESLTIDISRDPETKPSIDFRGHKFTIEDDETKTKE